MTILHIDFETFSACDLKAAGLDNYARHPSTGVHCMAFAFGDGPAYILRSKEFSGGVFDHVQRGGLVYAHNATFELAIWNHIMVPRFGWPVLKPEQCRCTMAMAYAMGLPGKLGDAAAALGIDQRKDMVGARIMMQLCKPKADGKLWVYEDDPAKFEALYDYCKQDVDVERAMHKRLMELSTSEQELWALDHRINQRGVQLDLKAIDKALVLVKSEKARLNGAMLRVTGGVVGSCTEVQLLLRWIKAQGVELPKVVNAKTGKERTSLAKAAVLDALDGDLPANVRLALELRKEAAKSSTAKLLAMKERAGADGRVRGIHQFHGAATGRWAGRGIQTQNLPRPRPTTSPADIESIIAHLDDRAHLNMCYGPVMDALADSVRGMIVAAPGHDLVAMDFSAIEARVLAWLAGQEDVLDAFRRKEDIYKVAAGRIYRKAPKEVSKSERQIGKVAVLALGYGGGVGAFQTMAAEYGVKVKNVDADEIKKAWREGHQKIVAYWYELENAAIAALSSKAPVYAGPQGRQVAFKKSGSFLWCKLPSGRCLCYPYPEIRGVRAPWMEIGETKDALTYMTMVSNVKAKIVSDDASSGSWQRISTYGGSLAENVTQAMARDLLAEALKRLEASDYKVVMHVHDEAVVEVPTRCEDIILEKIEALMAEVPAWATGLPLAAEGWRGPRYRK